MNDRHLRRVLNEYFHYYHESRTRLSLEKDAPDHAPFNRTKPNRSFRFPKLVDSIIDTSVVPHSRLMSAFLTLPSVHKSLLMHFNIGLIPVQV